MTDREFIWVALAFYAASGILTMLRLRQSEAGPATHPLNYALMVCGFLTHTAFLYYRGQADRHCPLSNSFETTVFITWAAVLFYLLVGPSYRVSFLGAFTAPVVLVIDLVALFGLDDQTHTFSKSHSAWVEMHAAIAILSYGAFALAFVAGIMYLVQERQLKSRKLSSSFLLLPSIEQLDVINYRLVLMGFGMLTLGMIGGFISYEIVGHWTTPKIVWAVVAWALYAGLLAARLGWSLRGRKIVLASMISFTLILGSYLGHLGSLNPLPGDTVNLVLVGLNHRTAPVEIRERLAFSRATLGEATSHLLGAAQLHEAAIVSTCNRVEIYGLTASPAEAGQAVRKFLCHHHHLVESIDSHLYEMHDRDCVQHLWEVVCGLDSMLVGETEILGQVKDAYAAAQGVGATGMALNRLFQKAFAGAKQVRANTGITRGSTSVGNVAVDLAQKIFRNLAPCTVMVVGTGEMSEATAKALRSRGAGAIMVCSRTQERAEALAGQLGGQPISFDDWPVKFAVVDIVISATAAPHPIITREKLAPLMKQRKNRPLFLIDIAVPRDIERGCGEMENVYLYDIDDLQQIAQQNLAAREREISSARALIARHMAHYVGWFEANRAALDQRYQKKPPGIPLTDPAHTSAS